MSDEARFIPASRNNPCPVCGGDHKCCRTPDGLFLCGRRQGEQPGFRWYGPCKNPIWEMYRRIDDGGSRPSTLPDPPARPTDIPELCSRYADKLDFRRLHTLAADLGLTPDVFARIYGIGFDESDNSFTFPEVDAGARVIGILKRFPDGSKRMVTGSRRGITMPGGWADEDGPIFLVEGPSDTLAMCACGLTALGRASNQGGADHLIPLLAPLKRPRAIVVVGENDQKPDGLWPGKEGAKRLAEVLSAGIGRPVHCTLPPPQYKDVREWVTDRYRGAGEAFDWHALGRDIARDLTGSAVAIEPPDRKGGPQCASFNGLPLPRRFPLPVRIGELALPAAGGVSWVWDGFLARDAVTLLSALPKCGKTTLLGHLLAALPVGGEFCGRTLTAGRAVVVSEEPAGVWAARRDELGIPPDAARLLTRGLFVKAATLEDWSAFLSHLGELLAADPADVVVFDTVANLWPVRDENSAAEVTQAMAPLHRLCAGRSVLLVHHLRKSDGAEGTGSRGSGAIAGFVDVILELRRQKASLDPRQRRRVLTGYGRYDAIPAEWVVELCAEDADAGSPRPRFVHVPEPGEARTAAREEAEEGRVCELREALLWVIPTASEGGGLTRRQIWDALPQGLRVNDIRFKSVLEAESGRLWRKEGGGTKGNPFRYRREPGEGTPDATREEMFDNQPVGLPD